MATGLARVGLLVVLTVGLLLAGCGQPGAQSTSKPGGEAAAKPAAAQAAIELKFNDWGPPGIGIGRIHEQAAKMVEERTGGKVKVVNYFSQSLLKYPDTFKGVSSGVADITLYVVGTTPGVHNLNEVFNLPFLGYNGLEAASRGYETLLQKFPELQQENEKLGVRWLGVRSMPATQLHTIKEPMRTPADIKGQKIISSAKLAEMVTAAGGGAVALGPPEWYGALEKGVAVGQLVHWVAVQEFKTNELFKSHTQFGPGGTSMQAIGFLVNLETWKKLSPDLQQVLVDVYRWANDESVKYDVGMEQQAISAAKQAGHTFVDLTPQEVQSWADVAQPIVEKWIKDTEAKGFPAGKVYEGAKQIAKESR